MSPSRIGLVAVVLACALVGCAHGYVALGYDAAKQSSGGGMASVVAERPSTGSVGVGVGGRTAGIELRVQSYDLDAAPGGDRFAAAASSFELRLVPVRYKSVGTFLHIGPEIGAVLDKQMMEVTWGIGMRAGGGAEVAYKGVAFWLDVAREELTFGGDVVNGRSDRDVVSLGIRVGGR